MKTPPAHRKTDFAIHVTPVLDRKMPPSSTRKRQRPLEQPPAPSSGGECPGAGHSAPGTTSVLCPKGMGLKLANTGFERAFVSLAGPNAIGEIRAQITDRPIVLVGGDQATGKGTLAEALATAMGGKTASIGKMFVRRMAEEQGVSVEEMSRRMNTMPDADRQIDFYACKTVAAGTVATLDSRLAGAVGQFLRRLGRERIFTVYLTCAPREQALRFVNRELSPEARAQLERILPNDPQTSMADCMKALAKLDVPGAAEVAARFKEIAGRDGVDRERLKALYDVDFRDTGNYDLVIDTTGRSPTDVLISLVAKLPPRFVSAEPDRHE